MSKARDTLLGLSLLALVLTGPAAVAAYFLGGDPDQTPLMLAATDEPDSSGPSSETPVLAGMLYTTGSPQVDWNGVKAPVTDGSYAYLGNEVVSSGPGEMGVLQLEGDNSVYMCPGSRISVTRDDKGTYNIRISQGIGRFSFAAGTDYRIEANRGVYTPSAAAKSQPTVAEVAVFDGHPGGVACGFSSSMDVAGYPADGGSEPIALGTAGPGEIIDLSRALNDEKASSGTPVVMEPIAMPASVQSSLRDNAPYPSLPGPIGYLCRCGELKRYADADGIPESAILPLMTPPATMPFVPVTQTAPSAVALATPGVPDPADAGAMRTPTPVTVPPPLVPISGSGGGFTSTPS